MRFGRAVSTYASETSTNTVVAVPVKIVSEILGHASVTLTYDTYSHVIPGMAEDATSRAAALVFGSPPSVT